MTIEQLIKELRKYPLDTTIIADNGTSWAGYKIYLLYDEEYHELGIYAK